MSLQTILERGEMYVHSVRVFSVERAFQIYDLQTILKNPVLWFQMAA